MTEENTFIFIDDHQKLIKEAQGIFSCKTKISNTTASMRRDVWLTFTWHILTPSDTGVHFTDDGKWYQVQRAGSWDKQNQGSDERDNR